MIFKDFTERLLGSRVKLRLLNHFLAPYADSQNGISPLMPASEREFAALVGISHTAVGKAFEDFYVVNLVRPISAGTSKLWVINNESYAFELLTRVPLTEMFRLPPLLKLESLIRQTFSKYPNIVDLAVIYGSIAKRTEMPSSDIDLMLLVKNPRASKILQNEIEEFDRICRKLFGNTVSVRFVSSNLHGQPEWIRGALDAGIKVMLK